MRTVINSPSREAALKAAAYFKKYFPYRFAGIIDMHGEWGYATGKTMAKFNSLARKGHMVYMVSN